MEDFNVAPVTNRRGGNRSWFCIVCFSIAWRGDPEGLGVSTSMDKGNPRPIVQTISRWQSENRSGSWCWTKSCGTIIQTHLNRDRATWRVVLERFLTFHCLPSLGRVARSWPWVTSCSESREKRVCHSDQHKKLISAEMSSLDNGKLRPFTSFAHTGVPPVTR